MHVSIRCACLVGAFSSSLVLAQDFAAIGTGGLAPLSGRDWRAVAAGDLDGDGDVDQVFACFGTPGAGDRNFWLRNDGTGTFDPTGPTWLQLAPSLSLAVKLADFDGDGDLDAFFGNQRFDAICTNDGTGVLALAPAALPAIDRETRAAAVGDLDGDGDLDILCACGGTNTIYRNDGSGTFTDSSANLPSTWGSWRDLDLADYDGDGDLDVLLIGSTAPANLYWNDGTGVFSASGLTLPEGTWLSGGDIDGDGDRDFWLGTFLVSGPIVAFGRNLYRSTGTGTFSVETFGSQTYWLESVGRVIDADGDGDLDLAIAGKGVELNDGTGTFTSGPAQPWLGTYFADLDGDGDVDLLGEPTLRNDGTGSFAPDDDELLEVDQGTATALLDFDGDGDLDLALIQGWELRVLANDGRGRFRGQLAQVSPAQVSLPWRAADLDGDGDPDLVENYTFEWFENLGGSALAVRAFPETLYHLQQIDGDGDGDRDLVATTSTGTAKWYPFAAGTFATGIPIPGIQAARPLAVVDCDGDGRDDVVMTTYTGTIFVLRCTGAGMFTPLAGALPPLLPQTASAVAADLDGDGNMDLVLGHDWNAGVGYRMTVLHNIGAGQFAVAATLVAPTDLQAVDRIHAFDVDGDGDLDLLAAGSVQLPPSRLLRNDGAFQFVDITGTGTPWHGLNVPGSGIPLPGDVDRDGDVDVVTTAGSRSDVLRNLRGQLTARGRPERGVNWRIEALQRPVGASASGVVLGLAELTPGVPTPFGELRIDPAGAVVLGLTPILGFEPHTVTTIAIPNSPAVAGVTIYAQHLALDASGIRFGNQIAATVP